MWATTIESCKPLWTLTFPWRFFYAPPWRQIPTANFLVCAITWHEFSHLWLFASPFSILLDVLAENLFLFLSLLWKKRQIKGFNFFFSVFDQCCHTSFEPKNFMQMSFKTTLALQVYLLTALHVCSGLSDDFPVTFTAALNVPRWLLYIYSSCCVEWVGKQGEPSRPDKLLLSGASSRGRAVKGPVLRPLIYNRPFENIGEQWGGGTGFLVLQLFLLSWL